ncbi:MAG: MarC family protein [Hyphomonadaceae bacterium]
MDPALISLFTASFVTFFVLIDAIGVAPIFASLTMAGDAKYRRRMALKSVVVATIIIYGFAFGGAWLLDSMHITIHAFRAAGGILLFIIALDMVFEKRTERRENRAEDVLASDSEPDDVAVFPIGIPMIAGPGTIATAMLYMSNSTTVMESAVVLAALAANLVLCLVIFLAAGPLVRLLGDSFVGALTRILGVILAALSIQLLIDGIKGAFGIG